MSITTSVRALLGMVGKRQCDLLPVFGLANVQSLSNKFRGERWSAADLVAVADACGCRLAFVMDDGTILPISAGDPVGADPVQASPAAAGQGVPVGESGGAGVGGVTHVNTAKEEKPLSE